MLTPFAKYEGAGNDFILIDNRDGGFTPHAQAVVRLCDRHFGIGADGLMTLSGDADGGCRMHYYNADGSQGEMCGNGARCFALFAQHLGIGGAVKRFTAADGVHEARICSAVGSGGEVEVSMTDVRQIVTGDGWWFLNTGVPHYVEFVPDLTSVDVLARGRAIRRDTARFPQGTNVNFVEIAARAEIAVRTYERGVEQETLACGTGATAAAIVTCHALQHEICNYRITMPGGTLQVGFSHEPGTQTFTDIRLTGPARRLFEGAFERENF